MEVECLFLSKAVPKTGCLSYLIAIMRKYTLDLWKTYLVFIRYDKHPLFGPMWDKNKPSTTSRKHWFYFWTSFNCLVSWLFFSASCARKLFQQKHFLGGHVQEMYVKVQEDKLKYTTTVRKSQVHSDLKKEAKIGLRYSNEIFTWEVKIFSKYYVLEKQSPINALLIWNVYYSTIMLHVAFAQFSNHLPFLIMIFVEASKTKIAIIYFIH